MLSVDELISSQSALTNEDRARLMELLAEWQLLSDLSFADLILWIPKRKDYQSWPDGHIAMAHIRPTTAATVFATAAMGCAIGLGFQLAAAAMTLVVVAILRSTHVLERTLHANDDDD